MVNKRKRVLMEAERYDAGGHKRSAGQLIVRKLYNQLMQSIGNQLAIGNAQEGIIAKAI